MGYHKKCLPSSLTRLNNRYFLCPTHNTGKVLASIPHVSNTDLGSVNKDSSLGKFSFKLSGNANGFNIKIGDVSGNKNGKKKSKAKMSVPELKELYSSFGLEYIKNVDYLHYQGSWCRFCGARYSLKFHDSLLGSNTFCDKHFKDLENGKIDIRKLKNRKDPFKPGDNKEVSYMKKIRKDRAKKKK